MASLVEREAYVEQVNGLLPQGRAWPRDPGTTLHALTEALATSLHQIDNVGTGLLDEIRPDTTFALLPDWERVVGLPDDCSALGSTIEERRAAVLSKIVTQPTLNAESYKAIARTFNVEINVHEFDQTRAAAATTLDTTNGKWRFVWWIGIPTTADVRFFTTLSDVNTPLRSRARNTELECRLQKAAPAHTLLIIGYFTQLEIMLPVHDEFATDRLRWEELTDGLGDLTLLINGGATDALERFQLDGNDTDDNNDCQLRTINDTDFNDEFETFGKSITVKAPGVSDLVLAGPNNANNGSQDSTQPYTWTPGTMSGIAQWVTDFKAAYAADNTVRATLVLADGE